MKTEEKPRKGLAIVIVLVFILAVYYFIADKPFGIERHKKITSENIDSLQKIIPKEMYDFLFHNDSLKICLNSMAGYSFKRKSITVYDSISPDGYVRCGYNWSNALKKWMIESRYTWRVNKAGKFLGTVNEEYNPHSQSWTVTSYDSLFYKDNVKYGSKSSYEGSYKLEVSDDGNIETKIWEPLYNNNDTKIISYKKSGKLTKLLEYSRSNKTGFDKKWVLKYVKAYSSTKNSSHTRTYYPNETDSTLIYKLHEISSDINDSIAVYKKYDIDYQNYEILSDSTISIHVRDGYNVRKHFAFSKESNLIERDIDSTYYDTDSNRYSFSENINYVSGDGYISYFKFNSLGDPIHHKWHSWNNDSTRLHEREDFSYYTPGYEFRKEFSDVETENGMQKVIDHVSITFKPDPFNLYETSLYWDRNNKCFSVTGITLKKLNKDKKDVEEIEIQ